MFEQTQNTAGSAQVVDRSSAEAPRLTIDYVTRLYLARRSKPRGHGRRDTDACLYHVCQFSRGSDSQVRFTTRTRPPTGGSRRAASGSYGEDARV